MKLLIAKRYTGSEKESVTLAADELEQDDSLVKAFKNDNGKRKLVGIISIGSYDAIYLSEDRQGQK